MRDGKRPRGWTARPRSVPAGDQRAGHLRRRRRAPRLGQARGVGRRRGLGRHLVRSPVSQQGGVKMQMNPRGSRSRQADAGGGGDGRLARARTAAAPEDAVEALRRVRMFADLPEDNCAGSSGSRMEPASGGGRRALSARRRGRLDGGLSRRRDARRAHRECISTTSSTSSRAGDPHDGSDRACSRYSRMTEYSATVRAVTEVAPASTFPPGSSPRCRSGCPCSAQRLVGGT